MGNRHGPLLLNHALACDQYTQLTFIFFGLRLQPVSLVIAAYSHSHFVLKDKRIDAMNIGTVDEPAGSKYKLPVDLHTENPSNCICFKERVIADPQS